MKDFMEDLMERPRYLIFRGSILTGVALLILGVLLWSTVCLLLSDICLAVDLYIGYLILEQIYAGKTACQDMLDENTDDLIQARDDLGDLITNIDKGTDEMEDIIQDWKKRYNIPDEEIKKMFESINKFRGKF